MTLHHVSKIMTTKPARRANTSAYVVKSLRERIVTCSIAKVSTKSNRDSASCLKDNKTSQKECIAGVWRRASDNEGDHSTHLPSTQLMQHVVHKLARTIRVLRILHRVGDDVTKSNVGKRSRELGLNINHLLQETFHVDTISQGDH